MKYKELIKRLREYMIWKNENFNWEGYHPAICNEAANAIEALMAELEDERYRHDRLQDFEVAESICLSKEKEKVQFLKNLLASKQ